MTIKLPVLGALIFALSGCLEADVASQAGPRTITTEADFRSTIVGNTVTFGDNASIVVNADGTVSGPWDGSGVTGTWEWEDSFWCRDVAIGCRELGRDCQVWIVDGAVATVTRDKGNGRTFEYTIG